MTQHDSALTPLPAVLTAVLEPLLNRWVGQAPSAELARLSGKAIALGVTPPGLGLVLLGAADRLQVLGELSDETPDVSLRGSPIALAAVLLRGDRGAVQIAGDASLLNDLQRVFAASGFDWAGWLEAVAGAGTAGPLLRAGTAAREQLQRLFRRGTQDMVDYLQEEARWLPSSGEFEARAQDVAELRDAVARLEVRIARIEAARSAAARPGGAEPSGPSARSTAAKAGGAEPSGPSAHSAAAKRGGAESGGASAGASDG